MSGNHLFEFLTFKPVFVRLHKPLTDIASSWADKALKLRRFCDQLHILESRNRYFADQRAYHGEEK